MTTKKALILTLIIASICVFAYFIIRPPSNASADIFLSQDIDGSAVELNNASISRLERQIDELSSMLSNIADKQLRMDQQLQSLIHQDALDNGQNEVDSSYDESPNVDREQARLDAENKRTEQRLAFEYRVSEVEQDAWSIEAENRLSSLLMEKPKINNVVSDLQAQCSDKLCKIQIHIPDNVDQFELMEFEMMLPGMLLDKFTTGTMYVEHLADGRQVQTHYMSRRGYTLKGELEDLNSIDEGY